MRTARKMKRVYTFTVVAWILAVCVFMMFGSLESMTGVGTLEDTITSEEAVGRFIIYIVGMILVLLVILLLEFFVLRQIAKTNRLSRIKASQYADLQNDTKDSDDELLPQPPQPRRKPMTNRTGTSSWSRLIHRFLK